MVGVLGLWSFIAGGILRGAGRGHAHTHTHHTNTGMGGRTEDLTKGKEEKV